MDTIGIAPCPPNASHDWQVSWAFPMLFEPRSWLQIMLWAILKHPDLPKSLNYGTCRTLDSSMFPYMILGIFLNQGIWEGLGSFDLDTAFTR